MQDGKRKSNRREMRPRRRPLTNMPSTFSYKDVGVLRRCITEQGAILPRTDTSLTQKQQRRLTVEIKRARHLALLPFTQTV